MQTVTSSEFCGIVKMVSGLQSKKGKSSFGKLGEDHGRWEELGLHHRRIPRCIGNVIY